MAPEPFNLDLSPLSEEGKKIAKEELRETPEVVAAALQELRELLANDDTIFFDTDDATLMIFLRPCKFYAKSAYELMKRVADFREKYKASLENLMPDDEKDAFMNHNVVNVLKNVDHKGRRVMIVNCGGTWNTSKVTSDQLFRLFYLIHIAATLEQEGQVRGCVVIMDFDGLGMKQVAALNPVFSMKLLGFIQDAMPMRLKEVHMVKQPFIFKMVWKIFSPFIREKLKNRIFFHGSDMKSLQKHIPASHLPQDYKGDLPKIDYSGKDWFPCIESHREYYKKWNTWGLKKKN
ncbi:retinaldehyde-binding protein 1 [Coccinella septempunctata]|uniref:retinaldehyde-binding protein 1 n=1 Tax=Coccinella septempunctata TaxID=41139 RepID=UPI001D07BCA8|nr:retinaldehyde-binding protein 1 [Coccinella septempunctata]XP_044751649.1 retinaldehyde-binding protein 1 [Coccinella septempunctata]